jgi:hypothetical protein
MQFDVADVPKNILCALGADGRHRAVALALPHDLVELAHAVADRLRLGDLFAHQALDLIPGGRAIHDVLRHLDGGQAAALAPGHVEDRIR